MVSQRIQRPYDGFSCLASELSLVSPPTWNQRWLQSCPAKEIQGIFDTNCTWRHPYSPATESHTVLSATHLHHGLRHYLRICPGIWPLLLRLQLQLAYFANPFYFTTTFLTLCSRKPLRFSRQKASQWVSLRPSLLEELSTVIYDQSKGKTFCYLLFDLNLCPLIVRNIGLLSRILGRKPW